MTEEDLKNVKFVRRSHMKLVNEHVLTYISEDGRLGYCDHTPILKNGDLGKTYRHWRIRNKVYKTKERFLVALENFK